MTNSTDAAVRVAIPHGDKATSGVLERLGFKQTCSNVNVPRANGVTLMSVDVFVMATKLTDTGDMEAHVEELLRHLEAHEDTIIRIRDVALSADIFCGCMSDSGQAGFMLSAAILGRMSRRRLDLLLDLYPPCE